MSLDEKGPNLIWGISSGHHDAALSILRDGRIVYASHAERYSKIKNDKKISIEQIDEALSFGFPTTVYFYENVWLKKIRYLKSLQFSKLLENEYKSIMRKLISYDSNFKKVKFKFSDHHFSHAAAGYYTSGFSDAIVVVVDAVGELDTLSVFKAENNILQKKPLFKVKYPNSVGLFYSHFTKAVGLRPNEEEFIFMSMAAIGDASKDKYEVRKKILKNFFFPYKWETSQNFHFSQDYLFESEIDKFDLAAVCQDIVEKYLIDLFNFLKNQFPKNLNWVYAGGVALNCVANSKIVQIFSENSKFFIFPNPGDAGSSIGAILGGINQHIHFKDIFLGTEIVSKFQHKEIVDELLENKICGVAYGRAEFGPRALGNRSLFADPTFLGIKNKLNRIKNRESFRPFGVCVLEEDVHDHFILPKIIQTSPFMQFVAKVKDPVQYPDISHIDGSCRIQTVSNSDNPNLYQLLKIWKNKTGCPFLINTSLNIKGQPIVNDVLDCKNFQNLYGIKVFY